MANTAFDEGAISQRFLESDWAPTRFAFNDTWQPVAHVRNIDAFPTRMQIHSEPCYLWRAKGIVQASRRHPDIPAAGRRRRSDDYPVHQRYGYAWVWYGDPDHAHASLIPDVPFLPVDGDLPSYMQGSVRFDCCSALLIENLLDLTHADFLRANVRGDEHAQEDRIDVHYTSETVTLIRIGTRKSVVPIMRWFGGVRARYQDVRAAIHVHVRSSVVLTYGRYSPGIDLKLFHPCVPESRHRCRLNFTLDSRAAPFPLRYVMPLMPYVVGHQDHLMVGPQSSRYVEPSLRRDLFSRFDGAGACYRHVAQQLAKRQQAGDFSYADDAHPGRDVRALLGMPR